MTESTRTSALASRHAELGSDLEDWNGMGTAWSYHTNAEDEHDAVREAAGMFDMSPLKKVYVRGADALGVVDHVISRDATKVANGQSAYGSVLTEQGTVSDDAIVANCGGDEWLLCHGSGGSMERLQESAEGKNVDLEFDDSLHNLALQGPRSLELLNAHTPVELDQLKYFHHLKTELFGHPCRLSRTGYSGERGYEILADASVITDIWDQIIGHGKPLGIMPASFTALDKVRIEAGLLFYGYDMTEEHTPWEVGLGFTVNRNANDYRGKAQTLASEANPRFQLTGLVVDHNEALIGGEAILHQDDIVGIVNSPGWSHRRNQSLALCHVSPAHNKPGTSLSIKGENAEFSAIVASLPFYDPDKSNTHA